MRRLIMIIILIGANTPVWAADEQKVQQAIHDAKQAFEKAVAAQGGWESTSKLLKDAQLNATKGDSTKALELANRAKREAELSYTEAMNQNKNWSEPDYLTQ